MADSWGGAGFAIAFTLRTAMDVVMFRLGGGPGRDDPVRAPRPAVRDGRVGPGPPVPFRTGRGRTWRGDDLCLRADDYAETGRGADPYPKDSSSTGLPPVAKQSLHGPDDLWEKPPFQIERMQDDARQGVLRNRY